MMRTTFLILTLFLTCFSSFSQKVDYDKIILPRNVYTEDFGEKLVRIAWENYPSNEILKREITISEKELVQAKWSWLENIAAQGNLNEFTLNPGSNDRAVFFPRYNFSARVTLNMFADIPAEIKKRKEMVSISNARLDQQKLDLRAEVLRRYEEYLMKERLVETQTRNTEDAFASYSLAEQQFKNGEITLDTYNKQLEKYNNENILSIQAESQLKIALINLEQLLGVRLEEVK